MEGLSPSEPFPELSESLLARSSEGLGLTSSSAKMCYPGVTISSACISLSWLIKQSEERSPDEQKTGNKNLIEQ